MLNMDTKKDCFNPASIGFSEVLGKGCLTQGREQGVLTTVSSLTQKLDEQQNLQALNNPNSLGVRVQGEIR